MDVTSIFENPTVYYILTGAAEVLVFFLIVRRGLKKGLVHELTGLISLAIAAFVLTLVLRIYGGISGGHYGDAAAGVGILLATAVVYCLARVLLSALHLAARLPVIRILDSILGLAAGLVIGAAVLYLAEKISPFFLERPLRLVTVTLPEVYAYIKSLIP